MDGEDERVLPARGVARGIGDDAVLGKAVGALPGNRFDSARVAAGEFAVEVGEPARGGVDRGRVVQLAGAARVSADEDQGSARAEMKVGGVDVAPLEPAGGAA